MLRHARFGLMALAALLVCSVAVLGNGNEPVVPAQKIVGAESPVQLGDMGELYVSSVPDKDRPANLSATSYSWKLWEYDPKTGELKDKRFRVYKDGDREGIWFGSGIRNVRLKAVCVVTHLYISREDGKVTGAATRTVFLMADVTIGGETPPGPVPPPPPPTPGPVPPDALVTSLKAAYARETDPQKAASVKALAALYRQASPIAGRTEVTTWGQLFGAMSSAAKALGVEGKVRTFQAAVSAELARVLPVNPRANPGASLDASGRAAATEAFSRVAVAIEEVLK